MIEGILRVNRHKPAYREIRFYPMGKAAGAASALPIKKRRRKAGVFVVLKGGAYFTLTSLISNCTATFGGNGVRGSAP